MTKYLGVSMIVLGTIVMLVSYLTQAWGTLAGIFPTSWVDINGIQIIGFLYLLVGGICAHVLHGKYELTNEEENSPMVAQIGVGAAALSLVLIAVSLGIGVAMEDSPLSGGWMVYIHYLIWIIALVCCIIGSFTSKKQLATIGLGVLAISMVVTLVADLMIYVNA